MVSSKDYGVNVENEQKEDQDIGNRYHPPDEAGNDDHQIFALLKQ